jgi:hypothetical protein
MPLPDPLPFPNGLIQTFTFEASVVPGLEGMMMAQTLDHGPVESSGHQFASLRFWRAPPSDPMRGMEAEAVDYVMRLVLPAELLQGGESRSVDPPPADHTTVVEAVTVLDPAEEDPMTEAFERCFGLIGSVLRSYRTYAKVSMPSLTRERLPPLLLYATRTAASPPEWGGLGLFLLHTNVDYVPEPMTKAELDEMQGYMMVLSREHPLALFSDFSLEAQVALERDGRYGEAISLIQTSMEVLFDGVLGLLLWETKSDPEEVARRIFRGSLFRRVTAQLAPRLGGDWSVEGEAPIAQWRAAIARPRNRIVHTGYRPSYDEAVRARTAGGRVEEFLMERLVEQRRSYPRTALLLVSERGLRRRGGMDRFMREFVARADEEPDWLASFRDWRSAVDQARG